tara:strand:+ start:77 stop:355 length:279 start_codon:yes stop_codon:yes gene_type:complete
MNTNNIITPKQPKIRFTFLINPTLLSQIKLISYISNQKLYETLNLSIKQFVDNYNKINNTDINNLINLNQNSSSPLNPISESTSNSTTTKTK